MRYVAVLITVAALAAGFVEPAATNTTTTMLGGGGRPAAATTAELRGLRFEASAPLEGWDGNVTVAMRSCDRSLWEGTMRLDGTLEGGAARLTGSSDFTIVLPPGEPTASTSIFYRYDLEIVVEDVRGTSTGEAPGTVTLQVGEGAVDLEVALAAGSQVVTVSAPDFFARMTAPIAAGSASLSAPLEPAPGCG